MEKEMILTRGELKIPCKISVPEDGDIRRIVLGVHGITGSANDRIQQSIAEEMELFYAATIRFDFPGHGDSPMDDSYLSLKNCVACVTEVARWARNEFPQVEDLCVFATGFGAYVTLNALEKLLEMPGQVKLVVHTPSVMMHQTLLAMKQISRETLWAMERSGFTRVARPLMFTYSFYEELENNIALATQPIPMLILHCEEDGFIKMEHIQQFRRINETSKLVIIPGTSHRFIEEGAWDMVLDLTRDWFEFEQVLLTDWI